MEFSLHVYDKIKFTIYFFHSNYSKTYRNLYKKSNLFNFQLYISQNNIEPRALYK